MNRTNLINTIMIFSRHSRDNQEARDLHAMLQGCSDHALCVIYNRVVNELE